MISHDNLAIEIRKGSIREKYSNEKDKMLVTIHS